LGDAAPATAGATVAATAVIAPVTASATAAPLAAPELPVGEIDPNPFQPRKDFDPAAIDELAASLKAHGQLQPLVVRKAGKRFQLIAGDRRLRAAKQAGLSHVKVEVVEADDQQMAELALVENLQRRDLSPLEQAASFASYLSKWKCTQEELASRLKINRSTLANLVRLLELPETVQRALRAGTITAGHARAMLPLGDEREQLAVCQQIEKEGLSVRATEELVTELIRTADEPQTTVTSGKPAPRAAAVRGKRNDHLATLEQQLRASLGTKVDLKTTSNGQGKITVHFRNHAEFERIFAELTGKQLRKAG
jgi:ParB family chromosome partitioning protein